MSSKYLVSKYLFRGALLFPKILAEDARSGDKAINCENGIYLTDVSLFPHLPVKLRHQLPSHLPMPFLYFLISPK